MTKAIIYCRFSPRPDAETSTSNDSQESRCRLYCAVHSYGVRNVFADRSISGSTLNRPQLQAAIESLGTDDVLVVDSADRLARDMLVSLIINQRVTDMGARIEYADGTPPNSTPEGELVGGILALFAQYQRKVIGRKTKNGLARKKENGVYLGRCPIGYRREAGKLVEDEHEQEMCHRIHFLAKLGYTAQFITLRMQSKDCMIRGRKWCERTIRRIIQRENKKHLTSQKA